MSTVLNCAKLEIFITAFFLVREELQILILLFENFTMCIGRHYGKPLPAMSVCQLFKPATTSAGSQFTFDELILLQETF